MDNKPVFRVGAAGLDPRDWRLIEIVFKHSQYNRYEFRLVQDFVPAGIDILIVNTVDPAGLQAVTRIRTEKRSIPIIAAVPRGSPSASRHAISIDRLTLQLLPILNRVVEQELLANPAAATSAVSSASASGATGGERGAGTASTSAASGGLGAGAAEPRDQVTSHAVAVASAVVALGARAAASKSPAVANGPPPAAGVTLPFPSGATPAVTPGATLPGPAAATLSAPPGATSAAGATASEPTSHGPSTVTRVPSLRLAASRDAGTDRAPLSHPSAAAPGSGEWHAAQARAAEQRAAELRAELRAAEAHVAEARGAQTRAAQVRAAHERAEQVRAEQVRAEQVRAEQVRAEQVCAELRPGSLLRAAAAPASELSASGELPRAEPEQHRLRALVVDDSPTVRQQLTIALGRMGIGCLAVSSAAQALAALGREHFDLALVDVVMPEMDGYRLTKEIRRERKRRELPVIILTSRSSPFDLARGALAGCDTYLTKPVPLRALEAALIKQLRKALAIDDLTGLLTPVSRAAPIAVAPPRAVPAASARPTTVRNDRSTAEC